MAVIGLTEAPESISFAAMSERQERLARIILDDPDVAGLGSYIGLDGTNNTLAGGRLLITLKPLGQRKDRAPTIMERGGGSRPRCPASMSTTNPSRI